MDLITVSQAIHWFDKKRFYLEAKRILKPGGVLGVYRPTATEPVWKDKCLSSVYWSGIYHPLVTPFVPPDIFVELERGQQDLNLPFKERRSEVDLIHSFDSSMEYLFGDMRTGSPYVKLCQSNPEKGAEFMAEAVKGAKEICGVQEMGDDEFYGLPIRMNYKYGLELGRN